MIRFAFKTQTIKDDRGRDVPLWKPSRSGTNSDPFETDLALRIAGAAARNTREEMLIGMLPVIAVMALVAIFGLSPLFIIPGVLISFVIAGTFSSRKLKDQAAQLVGTLLGAGRCGSCAYPVAKLNPEPDGCVACPECGAAWKSDPQWDTRLARADATAAERLNLPKDGTEDDQRVQRSARTFIGGFVGFRHLGMQDARGRLASVFFPRFPWKPPPCWDQVSAADRRVIRREIRWLGWPRRLGFTVLLTFPVLALWSTLTRMTFAAIIANPLMILQAVWAFFFLPLAIFGFLVRPMTGRPDNMANIFLGRGYCPGCASDLYKVVPAADNARECPHCLATWRVLDDSQSSRRLSGER